ncbi:chemotaxis protein CheW [Ferrovibrio sp.]|uniref:chemotaxis protein CheW n=1 Tax=Ferrovibrio sp. TaxID=1917215 RepID=UPI001B621A86|nr:chemotaxis protein CheW [Ferrovibrio sp.]MBP7063037.1 chemotaxis protein CheW [Ferrovibrio sp.]
MTDPIQKSDALNLAHEFLTLTVAGQDYAIDILSVREIRGWVPETPLPNCPASVRGVINLRGLVVPIYDLRARLGAAPHNPSATNVVIVVEATNAQYGLLADAVSDIVSADGVDLQPVPATGIAAENNFITALLTRADRMISVLDLDLLVATRRDPAASQALIAA